jgi:hypothetical protein
LDKPPLIGLADFCSSVMEGLNFLTEISFFNRGLGFGVYAMEITLVQIAQNENLIRDDL